MPYHVLHVIHHVFSCGWWLKKKNESRLTVYISKDDIIMTARQADMQEETRSLQSKKKVLKM